MKYLTRKYTLEEFEPPRFTEADIVKVRVEPILDDGPVIKLGLFLDEEKENKE